MAEAKEKLGPIIDDVEYSSLQEESSYEIETADGWTLVITRFKPIEQSWHQPLFGKPILCVHGFSQNRFAWSTGEFAKNMAYFGADLHVLELRGHGLSSRRRQREISEETGRPLPAKFNFEWSIDDYFLFDIPAAIDAVKELTQSDKVYYCGHSMGGMLGYGIASIRDDIGGLVTIGSAIDLGKESLVVRAAAFAGSALPAVREAFNGFNKARNIQFRTIRSVGRKLRSVPGVSHLGEALVGIEDPDELNPRVVRMDLFLRWLYRYVRLTDQKGNSIPKPLRIFNPDKHSADDLEWILTEGGEKEPLAVLQQFVRWINTGDMKCYASDYDFQDNIKNIRCPVTIIFGDEDILAGVRSTRRVYEEVRSDYVVWRPVRGNSHLEITMGSDIRQICYDIKNLVEFAEAHQNRPSRLPRFKRIQKAS